MMYNCNRCGDNLWDYNKIDCLMYVTCRNCNNEISFETKQSKNKKIAIGDFCRKCKIGKIIIKETLDKNIYSAYYYCPNCKNMYFSDDFKIKSLTREEYLKNKPKSLLNID